MLSKIHAIRDFFVRLLRSMPLATWLVVAALCTFVWFWIFGHQGLYELEKLIRLKRQLIGQQADLAHEKDELEAELRRLDDPQYLKHLIHREMGFVEPGEVIIKFPLPKP